MSTREIVGVFLGTFCLVYILGSMFPFWRKDPKPKLEYWYYSYTYLNQYTDKYIIKSSVYVGSFTDLVQYLNATYPNSSIFYKVAITKAEFEALK